MRTDLTRLSDEELALRCAERVEGSLDELIRRYEQRVRDCARRMSLDRQDAEDLVQEIFLRMITALPTFRGRSAFGTWMYRLAHNTCIDAFRRGARRERHRVPLPADSTIDPLAQIPGQLGDPEAELDQAVQECYVGQAVAALPPSYAEIVRLRLGEGRSNEEAARLLGTTVDAVKSKLRRARKLLRERLREARPCPFCRGLGEFRVGPSGLG